MALEDTNDVPVAVVAEAVPVIADVPSETVADVLPEPRKPRDPTRWVGFDGLRNGTYEYGETKEPRQREIVRGGVLYHHCAEDVDGCWLYRRSIY